MIKYFIIILLILGQFPVLGQQTIIGVGTRWNDSFKEWEIHTDHEGEIGSLKLTWAFKDDWTEWDFRMGDTTAEIRLKWDNDPNLWEIRTLGEIVTARTTWSGDFRSWKLRDGKHQITWNTKFRNTANEWEVRDDDNGFYSVYTYWEDDPREWVVIDEMDGDVSFAMKLAMIFISLYHSTPKI